MSVFDEFNVDNHSEVFKPVKNKRTSAIIKRDQVRHTSAIKKINPYENNHIPTNKGKITPLMDNDEIIGFIYECTCGEIAKVIFDFEETVGQ